MKKTWGHLRLPSLSLLSDVDECLKLNQCGTGIKLKMKSGKDS